MEQPLSSELLDCLSLGHCQWQLLVQCLVAVVMLLHQPHRRVRRQLWRVLLAALSMGPMLEHDSITRQALMSLHLALPSLLTMATFYCGES
jgi:hypothetical protein